MPAARGTYTVSLGGAPWMTGEAAQTVAGAPLALLTHSAVSGTHDKLGAFTGVAMTVGRGKAGSEIRAAAAAEPAGSRAGCGALEQDKDYAGNDIRFVDNVTDPAVCCGLCAAGLGV